MNMHECNLPTSQAPVDEQENRLQLVCIAAFGLQMQAWRTVWCVTMTEAAS